MTRVIVFVCVVCLVITMFTGCEDGTNPFDVEISSVTTTQDTVTITFSKSIESVVIPNAITFDSGTFYFSIKDTSDTSVHLGLLSQTDTSITLAVLGKTAATISGTYHFTISLDEEETLLETSEDVTFQAWSGTTLYLEVFGGSSNDILMQVKNTTDDASDANLVSGLLGADFTIFDANGVRKIFTFSEPYPYEYRILFAAALSSGSYWIRFSKSGYLNRYGTVNK